MGSLICKVTGDGARNAVVKITGWGERDEGEWDTLLDLETLSPRPKVVKVDAVYYALSEGVEIQLAWEGKERHPFLPLSGRGRIDYSEVGGLSNTADEPTGHIEFRVLGAKPNALYSIVLDLSKH